MMDPIVIDPPNFDAQAAWKEHSDHVEDCSGLVHDDGEPNWCALLGADPGCCSCPACGKTFWALGRRQRCTICAFEYPTDWWPMYSWGSQAATNPRHRYLHEKRMEHPYYSYGFEHPVQDPWKEQQTQEWRDAIKKELK